MARKVNLREAKSSNGQNALHFAAAYGRLDVCKFLVEESGFNVNSIANQGETPVVFAATGGSESVLRYLVDHGGDPGKPDANGSTPLHDAAEHGHCEAVRLLLSKGVDVDPLSSRGRPLHLAAARSNDQVVKILLEQGADPNSVVHQIFSPLMMACCARSLKCMKLLVEAGADMNFRTPYGPTALMKAADDGSTNIVKFLLEAGADPNIPDHFGRFAIMYGAANGLRELVKILFPLTKQIPILPNWSVNGIINTMKLLPFKAKDPASMEEHVANAKSQGKEAFAKGDYLTAVYLYGVAVEGDPNDATLFANRSLCWLRLRDGMLALREARECKALRPSWSKAWYREGAALSFLKDHKGAVDMFAEALKLDPSNAEIKKALREAMEAMRND